MCTADVYFYGGAWTAESSQKTTRFIDLVQTFHLPMVHLVDCPGFLIGTQAEKVSTIQHGARALAAIYQATVPWCSILVRKAFGVAGAAHSNHTRFQYRYAWPPADWGSLPVAGSSKAAYKAELETGQEPDRLVNEIKERLNKVRSPFCTAEVYKVEEIIDPRDTRPLLYEFATLASRIGKTGPSSFGLRP